MKRTAYRLAALLLGLLGVALAAFGAFAQQEQPGVSNQSCLACHADPNLSMLLQNGEQLSLSIDSEAFAQSVHGQAGYACVQCHTGLRGYPHPSFQATDRRDLSLQLYAACQRCHSGEYQRTLDSAHEQARDRGVLEAAVCTDCHGAHDTRRLADAQSGALLPESRSWIPQTCARCHSAIYEKYLTSVHGSALLDESNPDVPTCIDCHGVHDIQRTDDPERGLQLRENLLARCQRCHPEAGADFPAAWLSHYIPSSDHYPLVFTVNLFYKIFIPVTLGGMAVLVALDLSYRIRSRRRGRPAVSADAPPPSDQPSPTAEPSGESGVPARPDLAPAPQGPSSDEPHPQAAGDEGREQVHD